VFGSRGPKSRGPKSRATKSQFESDHSPGILETVIGLAAVRRPSASGPAVKPDRRPRLVDIAIEPLGLLHAAFGPAAPVDPARLRERWAAQRARFEEAAREQGHRDSDVKAAVYALAVALDEAVMSHPDKIGLWLQAGALQLEFHEQRDLVGGQRFFVRLDELRKQRDQAIEAIEVCDACLALGYRGRYVADPAGREALMASLYTDITAVRGEPSGPIAPNVARTDEESGETLRKLPAWVPPAVLAGAVLLSWLTVVLITFLHARAVAGALSRL
jgi:type VI secretion system protein ImpK